jgi:GDP-D-mannose dehydratase
VTIFYFIGGVMVKKRALITGITGMVGSHLADYILASADWDRVGMCRWRRSLDNISPLLPLLNRQERLSLVYADLRDSTSIDLTIKETQPDDVFHLAAQHCLLIGMKKSPNQVLI